MAVHFVGVWKHCPEQVQQPEMKQDSVKLAITSFNIIGIRGICVIIKIMQTISIMCIGAIIRMYLWESVRRMLMSAAVFAGVVWRNSLYQRRNTLVTEINSSDGSTTRLPR